MCRTECSILRIHTACSQNFYCYEISPVHCPSIVVLSQHDFSTYETTCVPLKVEKNLFTNSFIQMISIIPEMGDT